jgi:hypothetical protein
MTMGYKKPHGSVMTGELRPWRAVRGMLWFTAVVFIVGLAARALWLVFA